MQAYCKKPIWLGRDVQLRQLCTWDDAMTQTPQAADKVRVPHTREGVFACPFFFSHHPHPAISHGQSTANSRLEAQLEFEADSKCPQSAASRFPIGGEDDRFRPADVWQRRDGDLQCQGKSS